MEELTQNNSEPTEQDEGLAEDAVAVCPNCLERCDPLSHYCTNCGSNETINPLATYMPFIKIRFETDLFGKLWRTCWHRQTPGFCRGFSIFLALLYLPFIIIGLPFLLVHKIQDDEIRRLYSVLCYLFAVAVLVTFLAFRFRLISQIVRN